MLTNASITDNSSNAYKKYWLGETFDRSVADVIHSVSSSSGKVFGFVAPVRNSTAGIDPSNMRFGAKEAMSGYGFSQDLSSRKT